MSVLAKYPNRIVTREQLLDALSGEGSDKNDRSIDFLINRLRRKLDDDARDPRYIATRYGEGYVWIADAAVPLDGLAGAGMVIGPVLGLDLLGAHRPLAERLVRDVLRAARSECGPDCRVAYAPDCPPALTLGAAAPPQSIGITFFLDADVVNIVGTARNFRTGRILAMQRMTLSPADASALDLHTRVEEFTRRLILLAWKSLATMPEADGPLPVAIFEAGSQRPPEQSDPGASNREHLSVIRKALTSRLERWKNDARKLAALRAADPDDPRLKIMEAVHIHSKYVTCGMHVFAAGIDDRVRDEETIETLVLEALPYVQDAPEYAIMAAKMLHFVDLGYRDLARQIAEDACGASVSVASSLAVIGQLRAYAGEIDAAMLCIDQSLSLVKPGSQSHLYTLVIKCQILMSARQYDRLKDAKSELYSASAAAALFFEPLYSRPDRLSFRAKAACLAMSGNRAAALLQFNHYVSARLFASTAHRDALMQTPLSLVLRRFGTQILPPEISNTYADLILAVLDRDGK